MKSSTFRPTIESTLGKPAVVPRSVSLRDVVNAEWLQFGKADLIVALRQHPMLLRDRSLLLELAIEEYRAHRQAPCSIDLEQHCRRFEEFGISIRQSIFRQLETQRYIDDHPELLDVLCSPKWPKPGDDFGSFHVLEELGFGATAHVYLCLQQDVGNRKVVVKATPYSSFEASILGRLSHPNIIPIYSTGHIEECCLHYLCMPFCGRSTLSDLLDRAFQDGVPGRDDAIAIAAQRWFVDKGQPTDKRSRLLPIGLASRTYVGGVLALAVQIADALDHAHRQHILHGDLKPSNVLLTPSANALLLDFNLSQDYATSPAMCGGGTLPYMPPEYLRLVAGQSGPQELSTFEPTSDVYSFGALLYELLAGVTPIPLPNQNHDLSSLATLLLSAVEQGPPPIRRHNRLISRRLESLILHCLAFDKNNRPATMAEVKRKLKAETRSLAAVGRFARVRPLFFASAIGVPLTILAGAAAHLAVQPPRYLSNYERGLQLASAGEFDDAIDYFTVAVGSNPAYAPARFQLARTRMALGELDPAMNDFRRLARGNNDAHSMAYLGYCFNLKEVPLAAIPWYELSLQSGAKTAAIYNNLAASYLEVPGQMTHAERIRVAGDYLQVALKLQPKSLTVRLNIVRHAEAEARLVRSFNPLCVWRDAQAILLAAPHDQLVQSHVATWYGSVLNFEAANKTIRRTITDGTMEPHKPPRESFSRLHKEMSLIIEALSPGGSPELAKTRLSSSVDGYYLEPVSLISQQR